MAELKEKLTKFKEISVVYKVLSDKRKKSQYDRGKYEDGDCSDELELLREEMSKFKQEMKRKEIFNKIKIMYCLKGQKLIKEEAERLKKLFEQIGKMGKAKETEEPTECEYVSTILKLLNNIKSNEYEKCSDIIKKVTIAADDITSLVQIAIAYDRVEFFKLFEGRIEISLNEILEPVHNLFRSKAVKARTTICRLVLSFRSQFFHNLLHFSNQAKDRSTTHLLGNTTKECNSFLFITSTVAPIIVFI